MKGFVLLVLALIGCSAFGTSLSLDGEFFQDVHSLHAENTDDEDTDVYWRTWRGKLPKDAVIGGYTESDCGTDIPIYIGQALKTASDPAIVPVQIFRRSKSIKIPYAGKVTSVKTGVQVMCARDSSILTWVTKNDTVKYNMTADTDCVIGGTELQKFNTFFGRTKHDDNTVIGKVLHHNKRMYFAEDGEELMVHDYEMLCFTKAVEARKAESLTQSPKVEVVTETTPKPVVTSSTTRPHYPPFIRFG